MTIENRALIRCMGGRFCQHAPGACTARESVPTITETETVADFVPCERTVRHVAAMVEDWSNNALSSETSRMIAAVAKDILLNALPQQDRAEELMSRWIKYCDDNHENRDSESCERFARWLIAQGHLS